MNIVNLYDGNTVFYLISIKQETQLTKENHRRLFLNFKC